MRKSTLIVWVAGLSIPLLAQACLGGPADATCDDRTLAGCDGTPNAEAGVDAGGGHDAADGKSEAATPTDGSPDEDAPIADAKLDAPDSFVCDKTKTPAEESCVVSEAYGVFVAPTGADKAGNGTRTAPFATIDYAMQNASGKSRVYACAGNYPGALTVGAGTPALEVYGGFDCANWAFTPASQKVRIQSSAGVVPLSITNVTATLKFSNIAFEAAPNTTLGGSSIAAVVISAQKVSFEKAVFTAGAAGGGEPGQPFANYVATSAPPGETTTTSPGGAGGVNACLDGLTSSAGGLGATPGGLSKDGSSSPAVGSPNGGSSSNATCVAGGVGANGSGQSGAGGIGASASGSLSGTGWATTQGTDGANGTPGQGGGGGGARGVIPTLGGGGGGAGGCGGGRGRAGKTGGSSIAVVSFQSNITLTATTISVSAAGDGGAGGAGQQGQTGGGAGSGICDGGPGGIGSGGGGGGGGAGGVSSGIVWKGGGAPVIDGQVTSAAAAVPTITLGSPGKPGAKGAGGTPNGTGSGGADGTDGAAGMAAAVISLP